MKTRLLFLLMLFTVFVLAYAGSGEAGKAKDTKTEIMIDARGPWDKFKRPVDSELRKMLDPLQYSVSCEDGTERAFQNRYWDNHEDGIYVDVISGEPLFSSLDKYDSGSGWPSFTRPLVSDYVTEYIDDSSGMRRVEVRSKIADSHLGHVFNDGPGPDGLRYCVNSAAMRFVPVNKLETENYGNFKTLFKPVNSEVSMINTTKEVALLAGGCFWGMEDLLRDIPGVIDTEVGYAGGHVENAEYKDVTSGRSGHAEAVLIVFNPSIVSYEEILGFFFRMHDPTTKNRQGNDTGTQYRSAILYQDETQREIAERVKKEVNASGKWSDPIVTEIVPTGPFYAAEGYHQDYLVHNPNGYTCHYLRD